MHIQAERERESKTAHNVSFYRCLKRREKVQAPVPTIASDAEFPEKLGTESCRSIDASNLSLATCMYMREKNVHKREESCLQSLLFTV